MKHIITAVLAKLEQETALGLRYTDRNWGQLDEYNPNPPVQWPVALVDIDNVQYTQGLRLSQTATGTVTVTLAYPRLNNTSAQVAAATRQGVFDMMDLIDAVSEVLHGYGTADMQPLQRIYLRKVRVNKGLEVYELGFTTAWTVTFPTTTVQVQPDVIIDVFPVNPGEPYPDINEPPVPDVPL